MKLITDFEQSQNQGVVWSHRPTREQISQLTRQLSLLHQVQHLSDKREKERKKEKKKINTIKLAFSVSLRMY